MDNLTKLEFAALNILGKNYLSWMLDAEIHLDAMGLGDTIKDQNKASKQDCAKTMIFLRHHLDEILKIEYLSIKDPLILWNNMKEMYDHLKMVILPKAQYNWIHLRLQDFKSIIEYNSAMFRITSQLKLCGETISDFDMLEQTFSTFHASNNHENQRIGTTPFPKLNEVQSHHSRRRKGRGPSRGQNALLGDNYSSKKNYHRRGKKKDEKCKVAETSGSENRCYRCSGRGHSSRTCRTPKNLVELYQASLKKKKKNPEANFISEDQVDITHLDVTNFFEHSEGKIDHLIGDRSVVKDD
ncbi:uncharacterized protein LOC132607629 [Lycium barbarum]|uniref:uncharacterized protein LOC132607628 n=1 Tax=Lycium barbarum TaxID=112863 RepID=UPI00293E79C1|nr:uncharacterized protein LOC132607628 [Lycium barbarum]XP_060177705.1 uncharacterized protein LOC132607629 [Lycium barbarum]